MGIRFQLFGGQHEGTKLGGLPRPERRPPDEIKSREPLGGSGERGAELEDEIILLDAPVEPPGLLGRFAHCALTTSLNPYPLATSV
jgi:hypothetical protein